MKYVFKNRHIFFLIVFFVLTAFFTGCFNQLIPFAQTAQKAEQNSKCRKGPYLVYEGNNTKMKVLWQLDNSMESTIRWGVDTSYSSGSFKTTEYGNDHQHSYTIKKLIPGTKYYYNVIVKGTDHTGSFYAAPRKNSKALKFIVYGDSRSHPDIHNKIVGSIISTYTTEPGYQTFVLAVGDMATFGAEESNWDSELFGPANINLRQMMRNLPFLSCIGNHEMYKNDYKGVDTNVSLFKKYFPYPFVGGTYWSFDYGPAHFVIVDQYSQDFDIKELAWIKKDLASSKKKWKFVCFHQPGWSVVPDELHPNNEDVQEFIQPLLVKYNVTAVFAGHIHAYARAAVNGVHHITTGGGGAPLYDVNSNSPNVIVAKKAYHYCKVEIDNNVMTFTAVKPNGTVIDTFTINK
jgi:hypothetical protein